MSGEEGKSESQVACGREWRSRGCRRLPTAGEESEQALGVALGDRIMDSVTSSVPRLN